MAPDVEVVAVKPFIIWLDPGLTTGLASYDLETADFLSWQYDAEGLFQRLRGLAAIHPGRIQLGWEMYLSAGGPQHGTAKHSHEVIGAARDFAQEFDVMVLKPQPSASRKLGSPVFLRRLGWYKTGKPHANDAARHLLADLLKKDPIPAEIRAVLFPVK